MRILLAAKRKEDERGRKRADMPQGIVGRTIVYKFLANETCRLGKYANVVVLQVSRVT